MTMTKKFSPLVTIVGVCVVLVLGTAAYSIPQGRTILGLSHEVESAFDAELRALKASVQAENRAHLKALRDAAELRGYTEARNGKLAAIQGIIRAETMKQKWSYRDEHLQDLSAGTLQMEHTYYWRGFLRAAGEEMRGVKATLGNGSCNDSGCVIFYNW